MLLYVQNFVAVIQTMTKAEFWTR